MTISSFVDFINILVVKALIPSMIGIFVLAIIIRILIYKAIKSEHYFSKEFYHRVEMFIERNEHYYKKIASFHETLKHILDKTYDEIYILRNKRRKRSFDTFESLFDRSFGIQSGSQKLIKDTIAYTRFHRKGNTPNFEKVSRHVFQNNPYFRKLLGIIPTQFLDSFLMTLPSIFIICGILGTFVGVVEGLPILQKIDMTNLVTAKMAMGDFLIKLHFALKTSILGMVLSLIVSISNTIFSPFAKYMDLIDTYKNSLNLVWLDTHDDLEDSGIEENEHNQEKKIS